MYNLVRLKVRARNHRSLEGCFSGMTLIPVPIYGGQMSSKRLKWLFNTDINARTESEKVFCRWIFSLTSKKYFSNPLRRGVDRPPLPHGSVTAVL